MNPTFERHFSDDVFRNLVGKNTLGAKVISALRAVLQRSQTLTCEIHPKQTFHLYEGVSKVADIDCRDLAKRDVVHIRLNPNYVLHNQKLDWTPDMKALLQERIAELTDAGPADLPGKRLEQHLQMLLLVARAHQKSRSPEGVVEAFFVQQSRLAPKDYYAIDRQFMLPKSRIVDDVASDAPEQRRNRIDVVAVKREHLVFIEIKAEGDGRNVKEFEAQLGRYAREIEARKPEVVASYERAFQQRRVLFGPVERIAGFDVDWTAVHQNEAELVLLLNGYDEVLLEEYRDLATRFAVSVFAVNQMSPAFPATDHSRRPMGERVA